MSAPVEVVIAPARLYKPGDGDTFDLLVNFRRKRSWRDAVVVDVRLKGWRAQENEGPEKTTPELDPATGELIRVSGAEAARITGELLAAATVILVEFTGLVSLGREVCDVWASVPSQPPLQPLGELLLARRVVLPGRTMGRHA
jgi:hypothetical protein